jgi:predicted phosphodiesterase
MAEQKEFDQSSLRNEPEDTRKIPPATIQVMSDLHLETPRFLPMYSDFAVECRSPNLALLGDIGLASDSRLFEFLEQQLQKFERVFYVLGNHEPYESSYQDACSAMAQLEEDVRERRQAEIGRYGKTLTG